MDTMDESVSFSSERDDDPFHPLQHMEEGSGPHDWDRKASFELIHALVHCYPQCLRKELQSVVLHFEASHGGWCLTAVAADGTLQVPARFILERNCQLYGRIDCP